MIDHPLQEAIKILNDNNFITANCCSGHYNEHSNTGKMYIGFRDKVIFPPVGWKIINRNTIYTTFNYNSEEEFLNLQKEKIENLMIWVTEITKA